MVLGVTLLVFVVMSFSPSDPARLALGEAASAQALEQYRIAHHLNDPLLVRYWNYLVGLAHVFRILRNARVLKAGLEPRLVVCWGGHSISCEDRRKAELK